MIDPLYEAARPLAAHLARRLGPADAEAFLAAVRPIAEGPEVRAEFARRLLFPGWIARGVALWIRVADAPVRSVIVMADRWAAHRQAGGRDVWRELAAIYRDAALAIEDDGR